MEKSEEPKGGPPRNDFLLPGPRRDLITLFRINVSPSFFRHEKKNETYVVVQEPDPVDGTMSVSPLRRIPVDGLVDE